MSCTRCPWPTAAHKLAADIEAIYYEISCCLQSQTNPPNKLQALHGQLVTKHDNFLSATQSSSSSNLRSNRSCNLHLASRLWDTTRACLAYLDQRVSQEVVQCFIHQTFRGLLVVHQHAQHNQSVWAELIAVVAWTAANIGGDGADIWRQVAGRWFRIASDANPASGSCLLHLAILESDPLSELYYFSKSLVSLDAVAPSSRKLMAASWNEAGTSVEALFVQAHRLLLLQADHTDFDDCVTRLQKTLAEDGHASKLWNRSAMVACIICAALLDFGNPESRAFQAMSELRQWEHDPGYVIIRESMRMEQWQVHHHHMSTEQLPPLPFDLHPPGSLQESGGATAGAAKLFRSVASAALAARCYEFTYVVLNFIFSISHSNRGLVYLESAFPWSDLAQCLNQMRIDIRALPPGCPAGVLDENVMLRGYMWSWMLFQCDYTCEPVMVSEDRGRNTLDSADMTKLLLQRCTDLAQMIVKIKRFISFDSHRGYQVTSHAQNLDQRWTSLEPKNNSPEYKA